jgi:uncharacterized repeat protein (TIGR03803 family)
MFMPSARFLFLLVAVFVIKIILPAFAGTETVIYNFCSLSNCADGSGPYLGNLIFDSSGNLYGTTATGGKDNVGVVFELSPTGSGWKETVLHSFATDGKDGTKPYGSLVFDKVGNLYGTTTEGGLHGGGIVFELSPGSTGKWTETIIHQFYANGTDGAAPYSTPVFDSAGNLYGSTDGGGKNYVGSVYELIPGAKGKWTEKLLHSFADNGKDGWLAVAPVILDSNGNIYGTTLLGGSGGNGIVYELTLGTSGKWTEKILHSFASNDEQGAESYGALAFNAVGDLVSTTDTGGKNNNGTVYELIPGSDGKWTEKVLHSFMTSRSTGEYPLANIILDGSGNMYSTTQSGGNGAQSNGTIFEMSPNSKGGWSEKTLYQFCIAENCDDGSVPTSGVVFDKGGNMYGTTQGGGTGGGGVVYKFTK